MSQEHELKQRMLVLKKLLTELYQPKYQDFQQADAASRRAPQDEVARDRFEQLYLQIVELSDFWKQYDLLVDQLGSLGTTQLTTETILTTLATLEHDFWTWAYQNKPELVANQVDWHDLVFNNQLTADDRDQLADTLETIFSAEHCVNCPTVREAGHYWEVGLLGKVSWESVAATLGMLTSQELHQALTPQEPALFAERVYMVVFMVARALYPGIDWNKSPYRRPFEELCHAIIATPQPVSLEGLINEFVHTNKDLEQVDPLPATEKVTVELWSKEHLKYLLLLQKNGSPAFDAAVDGLVESAQQLITSKMAAQNVTHKYAYDDKNPIALNVLDKILTGKVKDNQDRFLQFARALRIPLQEKESNSNSIVQLTRNQVLAFIVMYKFNLELHLKSHENLLRAVLQRKS